MMSTLSRVREQRVDLNFSMVTRPVERLVATAQNGLEVLRLGGLETGSVPSPSQIVESVPMYKLRRYFPPDSRPGHSPVGAPVLMVHPMMMSADMWDVTRQDGAVGILHAGGLRRIRRQLHGRSRLQPAGHSKLDGAHRFSDDGPTQDRQGPGRLRASAA